MCGRYTLARPAVEVVRIFALSETPDWEPRYNIAPTQQTFVIRQQGDQRRASLMRWGLIPPWAALPNDGPPLINARAETVSEKPAFRSAFKQRRCLVPADGFFEWKTESGKKQPYYFTMADGGLFAVAGLWERWDRGTVAVESVTLLTTEANDLVRPCHDRMPVIVPREAQDAWLEARDPTELRNLFVSYPKSLMTSRPVGKAVGNHRNEGPQCIDPAGPLQAMLF